ncbi:MAG: ribosome biogenesis GTPase Der [Candidatus Paceibacteria bacterium]
MTTPAKKYEENLPTVAIVGRTNVGKSTLFNRLIEQDKAIVSDTKGTTRTSNEEYVLWRGERFKLIDTGGLDFDQSAPMEEKIKAQVNKALKRADIIIFLTDSKEGILKQEKIIAKQLQQESSQVVLAANKVDNKTDEDAFAAEDWYRLGFSKPIEISALNGRNIGTLLEQVYNKLKELNAFQRSTKEKGQIDVSIIGRPNAGKSTLFNKLIGEEEVVVSNKAHTTREPHNTSVLYTRKVAGEEQEETINFIDTAGIRKKKNISEGIEKKGVRKSINTIESSDVVLFLIDGNRKISKQDKKLGSLLKNKLKSVIIIINKWDLAKEGGQEQQQHVKQLFYRDFPHLDFAPVMFASAKTEYNIHKVFPRIIKAWEARHIEIPEEGLDSFLKSAAKRHKPRKGKGTKDPELLGMKQIGVNPIVFELYIQEGAHLADNYVNYLSNRLREQFGFYATPVRIKPRKAN